MTWTKMAKQKRDRYKNVRRTKHKLQHESLLLFQIVEIYCIYRVSDEFWLNKTVRIQNKCEREGNRDQSVHSARVCKQAPKVKYSFWSTIRVVPVSTSNPVFSEHQNRRSSSGTATWEYELTKLPASSICKHSWEILERAEGESMSGDRSHRSGKQAVEARSSTAPKYTCNVNLMA